MEWEGTAATVGGFITEHKGQIPEEGDELEIQGVAVKVEKVENHVVTTIVCKPQEPEEDADA